MAEGNPRVLRDYVLPQATALTSSIVNLAVEANNFELRPALVSFVEKDQFSGRPTENPHLHLRNFLAKCDTIKLNGVSANAISLQLFPFSLTDRASYWLLNCNAPAARRGRALYRSRHSIRSIHKAL